MSSYNNLSEKALHTSNIVENRYNNSTPTNTNQHLHPKKEELPHNRKKKTIFKQSLKEQSFLNISMSWIPAEIFITFVQLY